MDHFYEGVIKVHKLIKDHLKLDKLNNISGFKTILYHNLIVNNLIP